jgi:Cu/Ag efflux protein CusF
MSRVAALLMALVFIFSIVPAYSQEEANQEEANQAVSILDSVSGKIVSVDTENNVIVLKEEQDPTAGDYENVDVEIKPETRISKEDSQLSLSDLKEGDEVAVQYTEDSDGNSVVDSVIVK